MKKVLVITTLQMTIKAFLIPHIKLLEEMGYEVELACNMIKSEEIEDLKDNKWNNVSFERNPFSIQSFRAIKELIRLMKKNNYEMIYVHTPVASFIARFSGMIVGQKNVIYTAHGFHFYKGAPLINWLIYYPMEWLAMRWTDKIITINQEDYKRAQKMVGKRTKVYKINGVGLDFNKFKKENIIFTGLKEKFNIKEDDFVLLTLAELNKNKNQIQTLRAVKKLKEKGEKIKYILAGEGSNRKVLEKYIEDNNLSKEIILLGKVEKELIPELIQLSNLMISTSIREGLGLNLIEALASGKPIIATRNRGHKEVIVEEENGYFIEIGDSNKLSNIIFQIKSKKINFIDIKLRRSIIKFDIGSILEKMKELGSE